METQQGDVYFQAVSQIVTIGSGQCGLGSSSSPPSNYIEGNFETLFSRSDLENSSFDSSFFTAAVIRFPAVSPWIHAADTPK